MQAIKITFNLPARVVPIDLVPDAMLRNTITSADESHDQMENSLVSVLVISRLVELVLSFSDIF